MPLRQSGSALLVVILAAVLILGGGFVAYEYLYKSSNLNPAPQETLIHETQASKASLTLSSDKDVSQLKSGDVFTVDMVVSTDEAVNLISTKVKYPKEVRVKRIVDLGKDDPISMWVTQKDITQEGFVQLIGGVPDPGLKTEDKVIIARLEFEIIGNLGDSFAITPTEVELFSNLSNQPLEGVKVEGIGGTKVLSVETSRTATVSLNPATVDTAPGCSFDITVDYDASDYSFAGNEWSFGMSIYLTVDESKFTYVDASEPDNFGGGTFNLVGGYPYVGKSSTSSGIEKNTIVVHFIQGTATPTGGKTTFLTYNAKASAAKLKFKANENVSEGAHEIKIRFDPNNPQNSRDSSINYTKVGSGSNTILNRLAKASGTIVNVKKGGCSESSSSTSAPTATSSASLSTTVMTQIVLPKGVTLNVSDSDGDVSGDGKFSLSDLSVLFTRFNKKVNSVSKGDMNKDGIINTLDYSVLKGFMVKKKVLSE